MKEALRALWLGTREKGRGSNPDLQEDRGLVVGCSPSVGLGELPLPL